MFPLCLSTTPWTHEQRQKRKLHSFFTSNIEGGEWSASGSSRFIPKSRVLPTARKMNEPQSQRERIEYHTICSMSPQWLSEPSSLNTQRFNHFIKINGLNRWLPSTLCDHFDLIHCWTRLNKRAEVTVAAMDTKRSSTTSKQEKPVISLPTEFTKIYFSSPDTDWLI